MVVSTADGAICVYCGPQQAGGHKGLERLATGSGEEGEETSAHKRVGHKISNKRWMRQRGRGQRDYKIEPKQTKLQL
jgi:hypothetical protein